MLASIHPLGERARGNRWGLTFSARLLASAIAGGVFGALLGLSGAILQRWTGATFMLWLGLLTFGAGLAFELGVSPLRLPSARRQVNKDWLDRYRGWVYGAGFGFQLGLGVVTIVTTAAVYLTLVLAFLSASAAGGFLVGATFGGVRAATLLTAAKVRDPATLRALYRSLDRWRPRVHGAVVGIECLVAGLAIVALAV